MSVTYQNTTLGIPGAYTFVNPSGLALAGVTGAPPVLLIGSAVGGKPGTLLQPRNPVGASNTLRGGDLLNGFNFASQGGAQNIYAWRTDPATQSSLTVYGTNGNPSFTVTSTDYGAWTQQLALSLQGTAGALTGTLVNGYTGSTATATNLGPAFTVQYTGNGTQATAALTQSLTATTVTAASGTGGNLGTGSYSVTVVAKNAASVALSTATTVSVAASGTINASWSGVTGAYAYDVYLSGTQGQSFVTTVAATPTGTYSTTISQYGTMTGLPTATAGPAFVALVSGQTDGSQNLNVAVTTVQALVAFLNVQQGYVATQASATAGSIPGAQLDATTNAVAINGSSGANFTAQVGAVVAWLNALSDVTATPASPLNAPTTLGLTNMVGGSDGSQTVQNWQAAAAAIATMQPQPRYIVALTDNTDFVAPLVQAVQANESAYPAVFSELYIGGGTAPTVQSASQLAAQFASKRVLTPGWSFYANDVNSTYTLFPAYMLGALYAGIRASLPTAYALTNQALPIMALGSTLSSTDVQTLINNNVATPMINALGEIVIAHGGTTYNGPQNNLYYQEESIVNVTDTVRQYLIQNTVSTQANIMGAPNYGSTTTKARIGYINSLLQNCVTNGWIADFKRVTSLSTVQGNAEYELAQLVLYVPVPTNGMVYQINLQIPVGL